MDGTQTPGINYNSIDGLTTVSANSIIINGSTINLASYVPYVGATTNVDLNTKLLRNIGNAISPQDAVAFSQLGSYIPYTGAVSNPDFNTRRLTNIGDALTVNDAVSLQQLNAYQPNTIINGAGTVYAACGLNDLTLQADAIGFINIGSIIDSRGNAIINLPNPTNLQDAVNLQTLNAFRPSSIINGTTSVVCDGTYVTNNIGTSFWTFSDYFLALSDSANARFFNIGWAALTDNLTFNNIAGTNKFVFNGHMTINSVVNEVDTFDVTNAAGTSLFRINTTTPTINCLTTTSMNSNKITNLANGTVSGDAVNFGQLSTISSLIPAALPAGSVQGSYIVYDGTSYVNNYNVVYLGNSPGKTGTDSINIGNLAGSGSSTGLRIAIGSLSGFTSQAAYCISIGTTAGNSGQKESAIAIGTGAGELNQGKYAIAIGNSAGASNQHPSSIIINATGVALNSAVSTATYIAPLRVTTSDNSSTIRNKVAQYDTLTKELRYSGTTIFNVIVIGPSSGTTPIVSFMPTGFPIDLFGFTFTCTVVRNAIGDYTLTFPASSGPNLLTATITTGVNALITSPVGGSKIVTAIATASNTIRINYVFANVAFTDLAAGEFISLRIEFTTL